jgi:Putative peptidoglycan binding domain
MAEDRAARGPGSGPSRRISIVTVVLGVALAVVLLAAVATAPARAGGGGVGLSGTVSTSVRKAPHHHRHHHRRGHHHQQRAHHRHHRRAHHRRRHARRHHRRARHHRAGPLHGRAMWIWEMPHTDGGDLASIIAGAHQYRITTLIVKSSDGTNLWSQFTPALVSALHAAHLRVCAWQYVYGRRPGVEANLGADAVRDGADCLIIDAESEYEGKYVAAEAYVHDLRKQIGLRYPVALAGFPYVDFHPAFPYSVFLGPGGAQADVPQMYWRDIGTSVTKVFAHTYAYNLPYGRRIYPLGQVYGNPPMRQIVRFRQLVLGYHAGGVSWWDWQVARTPEWDALSQATGPLPAAEPPPPEMGTVAKGAVGDLVVWIQEHLVSAGEPSAIDGSFGRITKRAVRAFQTAHGLLADGIVGPETWQALLRYRPVAVKWVRVGRRVFATDAARADPDAAGISGAASVDPIVSRPSGGASLTLPVPTSAALPAKRDEIPDIGAGAGPLRGAP